MNYRQILKGPVPVAGAVMANPASRIPPHQGQRRFQKDGDRTSILILQSGQDILLSGYRERIFRMPASLMLPIPALPYLLA